MRPNLTTWQALAVATQFGFTLAVAVGLGIFVGNFLDSRFGTGVLFTILGLFAGLISAITGTVRMLNAIYRRSASRQDKPEGN